MPLINRATNERPEDSASYEPRRPVAVPSRTMGPGASSERLRLNRIDAVLILAGICLNYAIAILTTTGRLFWEDEVLGWMLLKDSSWSHMIYSWKSGADGGGFTFYLTGRLWFDVFGASPLSFRLYSATCFAIAFTLLWIAARRFYPARVVLAAFATTWFLNPVLVPHIAEGRFYGLFLASSALVMFMILRSYEDVRRPALFSIAFFFANSLLITSHILGISYSGILLLALIGLDRWKGMRRPSLYLAAMASWLWLIPSRQAIIASARVGRPHFWTSQPDFTGFLLGYVGGSLRTPMIGAVLVIIAAVQLRSASRRAAAKRALMSRLPILTLAGVLFLIPIIFWLEGFVGPSLFNERYMQPVEAAVLFAMAELIHQIDWQWSSFVLRWRPLEAVGWIILLGMVVQYDLLYLPRYSSTQIDYTNALTAHLPRQIPILCEDAFTFTELMSRKASSQVRYMYLLDWDHSVSQSAPRLEVTQYHLMENWKRVGYFADHILYRRDFLAKQPYFMVLHTEQYDPATLAHKASSSFRNSFIGNPLAARFAGDPNYQTIPFETQQLGKLRETAVLVCRRSVNCTRVMQQLKSSMSTH